MFDSGLLDFEWMKKKRSGIGMYFVAFVSGEKTEISNYNSKLLTPQCPYYNSEWNGSCV